MASRSKPGFCSNKGIRLRPSKELPRAGGRPAASSSVGWQSVLMTGVAQMDPAGTLPGQRTIHGTRMPPS